MYHITVASLAPETLEDIIHTSCEFAHIDKTIEQQKCAVKQRHSSALRSKPRHLKREALAAALVCSRWYTIVTTSNRMWVINLKLTRTKAKIHWDLPALFEASCRCDIDLLLDASDSFGYFDYSASDHPVVMNDDMRAEALLDVF